MTHVNQSYKKTFKWPLPHRFGQSTKSYYDWTNLEETKSQPTLTVSAAERSSTPEFIRAIRSATSSSIWQGPASHTATCIYAIMALANDCHFDFIFEDEAMAKSGKIDQMIHMDPKRDFYAFAFQSTLSLWLWSNEGTRLNASAAKDLAG